MVQSLKTDPENDGPAPKRIFIEASNASVLNLENLVTSNTL